MWSMLYSFSPWLYKSCKSLISLRHFNVHARMCGINSRWNVHLTVLMSNRWLNAKLAPWLYMRCGRYDSLGWYLPCLALQDDGSGRQQFTFTAVAGGYTMQVLNGRPTCGSFVTAAACSTGNTALTFSATNDGTGLQVWTIGGAVVGPILPNGNYQIRNTARGACNNILSAVACAAGNGVDMEAGGKDLCSCLVEAK